MSNDRESLESRFGDAIRTNARTREFYRTRERIEVEAPPDDPEVRAILKRHGMTSAQLPILFSDSYSELPLPITPEAHKDAFLDEFPIGKQQWALSDELDEMRKEIDKKTGLVALPEVKQRLRTLRLKSEELVSKETAEYAVAHVNNFFNERQADSVNELMRSLRQSHPELAHCRNFNNRLRSVSDFLGALKPIFGSLSPSERNQADWLTEFHSHLSNSLGALLYPQEVKNYNEKVKHANGVMDEALIEYHTECGNQPPRLMNAARAQLQRRHNIAPEILATGRMDIYNGSSSYILAYGMFAAGAGSRILMPEHRWDGYDLIASENHATPETIPHGMSLSDYLATHFNKPGAISGLWNKKPNIAEVKCLVITNPCSITGKEYSREELREILMTAVKYKLPVIFNEIHAHHSADGQPFTSITSLPEYAAAKNYVLIVGSATKVGQISSLCSSKLSYFYTANSKWASELSSDLNKDSTTKPFDREMVSRMDHCLQHVTPDYMKNNAAILASRREQIERWMADTNERFGTDTVKWHAGRPDKGYMSVLEFSPVFLRQAHIHNSIELYEYLYKIAGVSVGEVPRFEEKDKAGASVRINYGLEENQLAAGLELTQHALKEMQRGVMLEDARSQCLGASAYFHSLDEIARMGGGIIIASTSRNSNRRQQRPQGSSWRARAEQDGRDDGMGRN